MSEHNDYEGDTKEGWSHGFGRMKLADGVVYEGQFVKGHFHGEGKLIYPNVPDTLRREDTIKRSGKKAK